MIRLRFNTRFYDKVSEVQYEPSDAFIEVPKHVEERVNEIMANDERHKNSFEYDKPISVKDEVPKPKRKGAEK